MSRIGSLRILVVDNLADAADSLAMLLRLWGHNVKVCYDGPAAVVAALTYLPDAVLLDIGMPDIDGFSVARLLRARPEFANTSLIAITGYGSEAYRSRAQEAGFDHYLLKPVGLDHLKELLGPALLGRRAFATSEGARRLASAVS